MTWQMWLALAPLFVLVIVHVVLQRRWRAIHREALEEIERILKEQGWGSPQP